MKRKVAEKLQALVLRRRGYSLNEIVRELDVGKSSVSVWVRNVPLNKRAQERLIRKIGYGRIVAAKKKRERTEARRSFFVACASKTIKDLKMDRFQKRIVCALLYWCEGAKNDAYGIQFVNSEPQLVKVFLKFLKEGFGVEREKLRACLHLHEYHNPHKQIEFWSEVTDIPKKYFMKSYLKPNTGKRVRENYPGCISIRYRDNDMAREILALAKVFLSRFGRVR